MLSIPPAATTALSPGTDLLGRERDRAQAGTTHLIDAECCLGIGNAGRPRGLTGRVLALSRGEHLPQDHLIDLAGFQLRPRHRRLQRDRAEGMGFHPAQCAAEAADRGACGGNDDDVIHNLLLLGDMA